MHCVGAWFGQARFHQGGSLGCIDFGAVKDRHSLLAGRWTSEQIRG
jgi:hypothetical protein